MSSSWSMKSPYTYGRNFKAASYEEALDIVKKAFTENGWGLPPGTTDLDFAKVFAAKKIDENFRPSHVFGFCHAPTAHTVLLNEPAAAVLLPCNVVVGEIEPGTYQASTISPKFMGDVLVAKDKLGESISFVDKKIISALDAIPNIDSSASW